MCKGDNKADVRDNSEKKSNDASEKLQLAASSQGNQQIPESQLSKVNVTTMNAHDGTVHSYPNGVQIGRLNDNGIDHSINHPPGGHQKENADGSTDIYDRHGNKVGRMDKDLTAHIYTKNGEYTEKADGSVSFKPKEGKSDDLSSLHKPGNVDSNKYENYGITTDGKGMVRMPNGIELVPGKNGHMEVRMPGEYNTGHVERGENGNFSGFDKDGKKLYEVKNGVVHIPTADGELTYNMRNKQIKYESKASKTAMANGYITDFELV